MSGLLHGRGWRLLGGALVLGSLLLAGCQRSGTVTGKVLYDGQPLKGGIVSFVPEGGKQQKSSEIAEDGTYHIDGIATGPVKIAVQTENMKPAGGIPRGPMDSRPKEPTKEIKPPEGGGGNAPIIQPPPGSSGGPPQGDVKRYQNIPDKYKVPDQSGLTYTVQPGSQNHDIELPK